jgi:hypothetical protein
VTPVLPWKLWGRAHLLFVKIAGELLAGLAGLLKILIFGIDLPDAVSSGRLMPRKKSLNQHREEYLKLTVKNLFAVLNAKATSRQAKKKELLEAHVCFTREFLILFEEYGLIQED